MLGLKSKKLGLVLLGFQVLFIILFGVFMEYDHSADASYTPNSRDMDKDGADHHNNEIKDYYPMFQDVHVMIFVGFGFLMTFLRRYGFGAVGLNLLLAAFVIQWAMLVHGFFEMEGGKAHINIKTLLTSDFAAAAVLITFGSLLGKASPLQLILVAFIEIVVFAANEHIGLGMIFAVDVGGSMFVHVFGAYFGLACSRMLWNKGLKDNTKEGSNYNSDIFAMIGTIFLWLYWPSFNAALAPGDDQHRAVINTYLALAACCVVTFAISSLLDPRGKFDMVHIQNATLAGGVAVGTSADMMIQPYGALLIGSVAGTLSVVGYKYITPFLSNRLKIHDTCGVNNLHGMPGILAAIAGAAAAGMADLSSYGYSLYQVFPLRAPTYNSTELMEVQKVFSMVGPGLGRSAGQQAGFQILALVITLFMAIAFGALTGLLLRLPLFDQPKAAMIYDDGPWWHTPDDFEEDAESNHQNGTKEPLALLEEGKEGDQEMEEKGNGDC